MQTPLIIKEAYLPVLSPGAWKFVVSGSREERLIQGNQSLRRLCCIWGEHGSGQCNEVRLRSGQNGVSRQECGEVNNRKCLVDKIQLQK